MPWWWTYRNWVHFRNKKCFRSHFQSYTFKVLLFYSESKIKVDLQCYFMSYKQVKIQINQKCKVSQNEKHK